MTPTASAGAPDSRAASEAGGARRDVVIAGAGDVLEPEYGIVAIGSGGPYAQAAAKALLDNTTLPARDIVERSLTIAGEICIYTNQQLVIETL